MCESYSIDRRRWQLTKCQASYGPDKLSRESTKQEHTDHKERVGFGIGLQRIRFQERGDHPAQDHADISCRQKGKTSRHAVHKMTQEIKQGWRGENPGQIAHIKQRRHHGCLHDFGHEIVLKGGRDG